ncbi:Uma2 family endonuclease [Streptomyces sp. NPDC101227]|uniref:Uma2 family endonuclease n=1 Tax=Streptomyces sp. NPDC101227 TaxID=3366136 RepID=UPI0038307278
MLLSLERTETIETGGTEMDEATEQPFKSSSDELDELFEQMPAPEGYKVEIVEGTVVMSPQRDIHWQTIRRIVRALEDRFGMDVLVTSDVRIDFPGELNGFAPDVAKFADGSTKDKAGRRRYQDIEFVAEVISKGTATNDYGPKKEAYATAEVPVYVIADPYIGRCRVFTDPQDGEYKSDLTLAYGKPIDLTGTVVGISFPTDEFPKD